MAALLNVFSVRCNLLLIRFQTIIGKTYDSMRVLLEALNKMEKDGHNITQKPNGFNFDGDGAVFNPWEQGKVLLKYLREVT